VQLLSLSVMFDDDHALADAGLAFVGVLSERLGLVDLAEEFVDMCPFPEGRVATLSHAMVTGAGCIGDTGLLRSASTAEVLSHFVLAPSTLRTLLRGFDFGHVRQLDRLAALLLARAWAMGAGPGGAPMTIDVNSTICKVHGQAQARRLVWLQEGPRLPPAASDESRDRRGASRPVPEGLGGIRRRVRSASYARSSEASGA